MGARPKLRGGGRRGRPKTDIGRMLQDYFQPALHSTDFNGLQSGADISTILVDNSTDFSNAVLKWSKLTIRPIWDADDIQGAALKMGTMAVLLHKQDQDNSDVQQVDNEETIRELRNKKRIIRGPWWVTSPGVAGSSYFVPPMAGHMKAIVLTDFVLDREEDLLITFTNVSASRAATSQVLDYAMKGFVRVIK